jgi:hypothetical protein
MIASSGVDFPDASPSIEFLLAVRRLHLLPTQAWAGAFCLAPASVDCTIGRPGTQPPGPAENAMPGLISTEFSVLLLLLRAASLTRAYIPAAIAVHKSGRLTSHFFDWGLRFSLG